MVDKKIKRVDQKACSPKIYYSCDSWMLVTGLRQRLLELKLYHRNYHVGNKYSSYFLNILEASAGIGKQGWHVLK